ncbi:hypothetical protein ANCCEY_10232 [Ancylostoma ceylanicum]|uniref:Choline O-acetyltransferase n=1 Tax=Ancylostoma ceylanicum TaxID=53326 RepID=A0A0D6LFD6_9BILA|nr:hypothetical protein ANCCEY_10232 [Ancylostoma ceylanicum]
MSFWRHPTAVSGLAWGAILKSYTAGIGACVLLTKELDLGVLIFNDFGRDFIKENKFSPDGFVQLALQLAHFKLQTLSNAFRLHGYLVSTYESASLRRYRSGRVDNIRANTKEALEWVKAMTRDSARETKLTLLRKAAEKQAKVTQEVCVI